MSQKIIHSYPIQSELFEDIEKLYFYTSERKTLGILSYKVPSIFEDILNIIQDNSNAWYNIHYIDKDYKKLSNVKFDDKNLLLCFSAGKDSTTAALHYKKLGYNVVLYHLLGINKGYNTEEQQAKELASKLDLPIVFQRVKLSGTHDWIEHPLKNWIIVSMALQYGIENKFTTKIATGNFKTCYLRDNPFEICAGDCIELWKAFESVVKTIIPNFKMYISNKNMQTAFNVLIKNPEYIEDTISCLTPVRFRNQLRYKNINKYGFPKLKNRCGSCWKCCCEYIILCDNGIEEYNREYYRHCLQVLRNNFRREMGYFPIDLWSCYFSHDRNKGYYREAIKVV